jgi:hypothetical protein
MVDPRPTEESVIGPVLDALGGDCDHLGSEHIHYYCMCDYDFSLVFERYMCRHTGLVPADETVTPEEVAVALQEVHAREMARRAREA